MRLPWFRRRRPEAAPAPEPLPVFDASIDFDAGAGAALDEIRRAVAAIPGAGWVSVEPHAGADLDIRLFAAGSGREAMGEAWDALRREVEGAVRRVLAGGQPARWSTPEPEALGFAEPPASLRRGFAEPPASLRLGFAEPPASLRLDAPKAAVQLDALEALAALAALKLGKPAPKRARPAEPPPPVIAAPAPKPVALEPGSAEDVFRLTRLLTLVLPAEAEAPAASAIHRFGSFGAVLAAPEAELRRVPGIGTHCVAAIKLVHAAAIRHARAAISDRPVLDDRKRLADYLAAALARERIEQFRILFLDDSGMLRADEVQARGTVNHTPVYPREVVRRALALGASSLILVHNHPSGDPAPSREDIEMTKQVQDAAAILQIGLRDHIIIGNGRWLSFREEGLLG